MICINLYALQYTLYIINTPSYKQYNNITRILFPYKLSQRSSIGTLENARLGFTERLFYYM